MTGIELIAQEREEQLTKHNRSIKADILYNSNRELIIAATTLLGTSVFYKFPENWNKTICEKMLKKPKIEQLAIAGAFIAAEIDRLNNS